MGFKLFLYIVLSILLLILLTYSSKYLDTKSKHNNINIVLEYIILTNMNLNL